MDWLWALLLVAGGNALLILALVCMAVCVRRGSGGPDG
jgi:hypothetical protein